MLHTLVYQFNIDLPLFISFVRLITFAWLNAIASAAAVPSSRSEAFAIGNPVKSEHMV